MGCVRAAPAVVVPTAQNTQEGGAPEAKRSESVPVRGNLWLDALRWVPQLKETKHIALHLTSAMAKIQTETETVIKRILPYLERRGYDISVDLDFETSVTTSDRYSKGYVDILVTLGKAKAAFLIEAKRLLKNLTDKDRDQALSYARSKEVNVPFVVVTNGINVRCYNSRTAAPIKWNGKTTERIPSRTQLSRVLRTLRAHPEETDVALDDDKTLPYRPGLPLRQLNALFSRCHNAIRKIEKNEEHAFADFSKLLFLKLLEEKYEVEEKFELPYSYRLYELAEQPDSKSDQVKVAILNMIDEIVKKTRYGEVLQDTIYLKNPKTFHYIVRQLSSVSFYDSSLDSKGAAFEYFVRATLKGKKLGQYFTPRELIRTMVELIGREKVHSSLRAGNAIKVLDPACGTGGFLVYLMQDTLRQLDNDRKDRKITKALYDELSPRIKESTFYGSDANEGVAASAKMNMIIAGDGHTNIRHEDSLAVEAENWSVAKADCDIILTNPPFGTSEADSLDKQDYLQYPVPANAKGQHLFLQKMVQCTKPGGDICTVIDEGVLNTESASDLRQWLLSECRINAVVRLPSETFKPNKINVRASVLYMTRREQPDSDYDDSYAVAIGSIDSLGYQGSGDKIRGFDQERLFDEIGKRFLKQGSSSKRSGYHWKAFDVKAKQIAADPTFRFDFKYWEPATRSQIGTLIRSGSPTIEDINTIPTLRGTSPPAESYVDANEGYAVVLKAGSSITKFGRLDVEGADYIEKNLYDDYVEKADKSGKNGCLVQTGDVLLASTGDGTLGKACVYDLDMPAIADGHVTIIRVNRKKIDPYFLADYLRSGFGANQIQRLYTGSTGLIELTTEHVKHLVVDARLSVAQQRALSNALRKKEDNYQKTVQGAESKLEQALGDFRDSA